MDESETESAVVREVKHTVKRYEFPVFGCAIMNYGKLLLFFLRYTSCLSLFLVVKRLTMSAASLCFG